MAEAVEISDISEDELQAIKDCFALLDTNNDGMIDADELEAGFEEFGQKRRRSSIIRMIDKADKNSDQKVDFEEFALLMKENEMDGTIQRASEAAGRKADDIDSEKEEKNLQKRAGKFKLSKDDVNASIYGNLSAVKVAETQELVLAKIDEFDAEVKATPPNKIKAFMMAMEKIPETIDNDYKLMFLRAELFDVKKAVVRCCRHWDFVLEMFGPEKAFLPLTQAGALCDDAETLRAPIFNDTGVKDEHGQHIFLLNYRSTDSTKLDYRAVCRCTVYVVMKRLERDEEAQKNGCVVQMLFPESTKTWNMKISKNMLAYTRNGVPARIASLQVMYPVGLFKIMFRMLRILAGSLSIRMKIFDGTKEDVLAKLKAVGIDKESVPEVLGGNLALDREKYVQELAELEK